MRSEHFLRRRSPWLLLIGVTLFVSIDALTESAHHPHQVAPTAREIRINEILSDPRIEEARKLAQELIAEYPPDKYVVIGLGRTTGVTGEWVRRLSMREDYFVDAPIENIKAVLNTSLENQLWKSIIPNPKMLNGREIVIHRVLWTGHTMGTLLGSLHSYLETQKPKNKATLHLVAEMSDFGLDGFKFKWRADKRFEKWINYKYRPMDSSIRERFVEDLDDYNHHANRIVLTDFGKYEATGPKTFIQKGFDPNPHYQALESEIRARDCIPLINSL